MDWWNSRFRSVPCRCQGPTVELGMFQRGNWLTIALQRLGICDALFEIPWNPGWFITTPRKLTWNLKIIPLQRKMNHLPRLHHCVPAVDFKGLFCVSFWVILLKGHFLKIFPTSLVFINGKLFQIWKVFHLGWMGYMAWFLSKPNWLTQTRWWKTSP